MDGFGGTDTLIGIERVRGSNFDDTIIGDDGVNRLEGNVGNDIIIGGDGDDRLIGNRTGGPTLPDGDDILVGGAGTNEIEGNDGNDFLIGGNDATTGQGPTAPFEILDGGTGNDVLIGQGGNNELFGGDGVDILAGGSDVNRYIGGAGDDFFYGGTRGLTSRDIDFAFYADTTGPITVSYSTAATITSADGVDVTRNVPSVRGSDFDDTFVADGNYLAFSPSGSLSPLVDFRGGDGNDTIIGTGNTLIRAGYSDADGGVTVDFALGTAFGTLVPGGATNIGTDTLVDVVQVRGSNFDDTLLGSDTVAYRENFKGQEGNDFINGRGGLDRADYRSEGCRFYRQFILCRPLRCECRPSA